MRPRLIKMAAQRVVVPPVADLQHQSRAAIERRIDGTVRIEADDRDVGIAIEIVAVERTRRIPGEPGSPASPPGRGRVTAWTASSRCATVPGPTRMEST